MVKPVKKDRGKGKKEAKGKQGKIRSYFLRVASLADIARNVSTFGEGVRPLYAVKEGRGFRLISHGIKLGDERLMLYFDTDECKSFLTYKPGTSSEKETVYFKDTIFAAVPGQDTQNIPILEFATNPFETAKEKPKVMCLEVKHYSAVVKGVIGRSLENGGIGKVYMFRSGKDWYAGSFSLLGEEDDTRVFAFARLEANGKHHFFRYNYNTDKVELTDSFGEHSYMYLRIINLQEAPSFFKPMPD